MRINYIEYHNKNVDWRLERVHFGEMTLLVGASGVGKTRILDAINTVKKVAGGKGFFGIQWEVSFTLLNGDSYLWEGEFQKSQNTSRGGRESEPYKIIFEKIRLKEKVIAERELDKVYFNGESIPKLSNDQSLVRLLNEEDLIKPVFKGFKKILLSNEYYEELVVTSKKNTYKFFKEEGEILDIEEIRALNHSPLYKLYLASLSERVVFSKIGEQFSEIFPQVENIAVKVMEEYLPAIVPVVLIKEKGVSEWIWHGDLSSGMVRTLLHLIELHLYEEGSLIMVDEFENSLGVNCIDAVTDIVLNPNRHIQYILTSHHPYVINNIDFKHWKIVTRKGGVVSIHDSSEYNLGKSRHQRFLQLIQLDAFRSGIAS